MLHLLHASNHRNELINFLRAYKIVEQVNNFKYYFICFIYFIKVSKITQQFLNVQLSKLFQSRILFYSINKHAQLIKKLNTIKMKESK